MRWSWGQNTNEKGEKGWKIGNFNMKGICFSQNLLDTIPSKKRGCKDEIPPPTPNPCVFQ